MKTDGTGLAPFFETGTYASNLSVSDGTLYFVNNSDGALYSVLAAGASAMQLSNTLSGISAFSIEGATFWELSTKALYRGSAGLLPKQLAPYPRASARTLRRF